MEIVFSCEHCSHFHEDNGFDCNACTDQNKFANVAEPNLNAVLADVLADFETIDLNDGGSKFVTFKKVEFKETLGKYFS